LSSEFANHPNNPFPGYALFGGNSSPKVNHPEVNVLSDDRIEVFIYIRIDTDDWYPVDDPWRQITRIELDASDKDWNNWHLAAIRIFPNPVHSEINVHVLQTAIITVMNLQGGTIFKTVVEGKATFDVTGLRSGIYFVKAEFSNGIITKKWIKQ